MNKGLVGLSLLPLFLVVLLAIGVVDAPAGGAAGGMSGAISSGVDRMDDMEMSGESDLGVGSKSEYDCPEAEMDSGRADLDEGGDFGMSAPDSEAADMGYPRGF